jgi:hypothetical protein
VPPKKPRRIREINEDRHFYNNRREILIDSGGDSAYIHSFMDCLPNAAVVFQPRRNPFGKNIPQKAKQTKIIHHSPVYFYYT